MKILELPDASRILRFEGLDTSDGPDLRVWLTDAPVLEGQAGWYVFDDGAHLDLGAAKANKGDQNYETGPQPCWANTDPSPSGAPGSPCHSRLRS